MKFHGGLRVWVVFAVVMADAWVSALYVCCPCYKDLQGSIRFRWCPSLNCRMTLFVFGHLLLQAAQLVSNKGHEYILSRLMTFTGFSLPVATLRDIATATADRRNRIPQNAALVFSEGARCPRSIHIRFSMRTSMCKGSSSSAEQHHS